MDKVITRLGIGFAYVIWICELTYINAKSLFFLVNDFSDIDRYFSLVGSLAFSTITVIVMRKSTEKWPKIVFPVFDSLLIFCGLNLKFYDAIIAGTDNQVRFFLTVFIAVFTGITTYSLGIINYREHKSENNSDESELESDLSEINSLKSKIDKLESDLMDRESDIDNYKAELELRKSEMKSIRTHCDMFQSELEKYKTGYLQAEKSRILKKKEENRTAEEVRILEKCAS